MSGEAIEDDAAYSSYEKFVEGLNAVFDADGERDEVLDEFQASVDHVERRNEATYASLRQRCGGVANRVQVLAVSLAAVVAWSADKSLYMRSPRGVGIVVMATITAMAAIVAVSAALSADRMIQFKYTTTGRMNPFTRDSSTAAYRLCYRLWLLPSRMSAANSTAASLEAASRRVGMAQTASNLAIAAFLCLATMISAFGLLP